ncbi:MAG: hypothetical protein QOH49_2326 [Acidobacteriota bacterium]|jgi:hypothetical protein|nr:hypothetical protein [Acidobacteriota bacterium]
MSERLRILFLAANPHDTSEVAWDTEHRLLRNTLHDNVEAANCEILTQQAARPTELQMALATFKPHVVHFAGHGNDAGIYLENDEGRSCLVSGEWLELLFNVALKHVRLIVLNACSSEAQTEKFRQFVDYVVGTNDAIADGAAVLFTAQFYRGIAVGETVREAFLQAQGKLAAGGRLDMAEHYKLLVRAGVDESKPLLPPRAEGSSVTFKAGEIKSRKAVFAEQVRIGEGAPAPPGQPAANKGRNKVEVTADKTDVGELYVCTEYHETGRQANDEGAAKEEGED